MGMKKTDRYIRGVQEIISRAKRYQSGIGNYIEHFDSELKGFSVKLSNGRLRMADEIAHDQETSPGTVTEEDIRRIAGTFQRE